MSVCDTGIYIVRDRNVKKEPTKCGYPLLYAVLIFISPVRLHILSLSYVVYIAFTIGNPSQSLQILYTDICRYLFIYLFIKSSIHSLGIETILELMH